MTVTKAIERLQLVLVKHGDVEVYFDCPSCKQAFTPGYVETKAVVVASGSRNESSQEHK